MKQSELFERFRSLHEQDNGVVMPNPWDGVSALLLKHAFDPDDAELPFRKAVVHRTAGQPAEAENCWRRILTRAGPTSFAALTKASTAISRFAIWPFWPRSAAIARGGTTVANGAVRMSWRPRSLGKAGTASQVSEIVDLDSTKALSLGREAAGSDVLDVTLGGFLDRLANLGVGSRELGAEALEQAEHVVQDQNLTVATRPSADADRGDRRLPR